MSNIHGCPALSVETHTSRQQQQGIVLGLNFSMVKLKLQLLHVNRWPLPACQTGTEHGDCTGSGQLRDTLLSHARSNAAAQKLAAHCKD